MRRPVSTDSKAASAIASARAPSMPVGEGRASLSVRKRSVYPLRVLSRRQRSSTSQNSAQRSM